MLAFVRASSSAQVRLRMVGSAAQTLRPHWTQDVTHAFVFFTMSTKYTVSPRLGHAPLKAKKHDDGFPRQSDGGGGGSLSVKRICWTESSVRFPGCAVTYGGRRTGRGENSSGFVSNEVTSNLALFIPRGTWIPRKGFGANRGARSQVRVTREL